MSRESVCYVTKVMNLLSSEEANCFYNGCGSSIHVLRMFRLPETYARKFKICCDWHDIAYWIGGDREDRLAYDIEFYRRLKSICGNDLKNRFWAWVCYRAVRDGGFASFEYGRKKTIDEMKKIAQGLADEMARREVQTS